MAYSEKYKEKLASWPLLSDKEKAEVIEFTISEYMDCVEKQKLLDILKKKKRLT